MPFPLFPRPPKRYTFKRVMQSQPLCQGKLHAGFISVGICQMQSAHNIFGVIMMFYHFNYKHFEKKSLKCTSWGGLN